MVIYHDNFIGIKLLLQDKRQVPGKVCTFVPGTDNDADSFPGLNTAANRDMIERQAAKNDNPVGYLDAKTTEQKDW